MAIRKNKKRFDPRYFMDEKMEEPLNEEKSDRTGLRIPASNPAADRWHREQKEAARKEEERKRREAGQFDDNVGRHTRADHSVNHSLEEDLSHLADPAVWEALVQAGWKLANIWGPLVGIAGFGIIIKDAIEYLKKSPKSSHDDAIQYAIDNAKQEAEKTRKEKLNEDSGQVKMFFTMAQAHLQREFQAEVEHLEGYLASVKDGTSFEEFTGEKKQKEIEKIEKQISEMREAFDAKIDAMAGLMSPQIVNALMELKEHATAIGDIHQKLGALYLSDNRVNKLEPGTANLFKILKVLGKYTREWAV